MSQDGGSNALSPAAASPSMTLPTGRPPRALRREPSSSSSLEEPRRLSAQASGEEPGLPRRLSQHSGANGEDPTESLIRGLEAEEERLVNVLTRRLETARLSLR